MNKTICGFECKFLRQSDVRYFFNFHDNDFAHYYFSVVDAFVCSHCRRIKVLERFRPSYFQDLIDVSFVCENLVLHLYPENIEPQEIDDYSSFLESKCEMIILMYDFCYLEIYCKNQVWLQNLIQVATNIPNAIVNAKYEETDTRTSMYT